MLSLIVKSYATCKNFYLFGASRISSINDKINNKRYKLLLPLAFMPIVLLCAYANFDIRTIPVRQEYTEELVKGKLGIPIGALDVSLLPITKSQQRLGIKIVRYKIIPRALHQILGSQSLVARSLVSLAQHSFIAGALISLFCSYDNWHRNSAIGLGLPLLISIILLIRYRKKFYRQLVPFFFIFFTSVIYLSFIFTMVINPLFWRFASYYGNTIYIIEMLFIILGMSGLDPGVAYVCGFASVFFMDFLATLAITKANEMLPYGFIGIGGAGFNDGIFIYPLRMAVWVLIGWLLKQLFPFSLRAARMLYVYIAGKGLVSRDHS